MTGSYGVLFLVALTGSAAAALPFRKGLKGKVHTAHAETFASYPKPGTYFATVRIASNRHGDASEAFTQVLNLDRARIVVT